MGYRWDSAANDYVYMPDDEGDSPYSPGLGAPDTGNQGAPGRPSQANPVLDWGAYKTLNIGGSEHLFEEDLYGGKPRIGRQVMDLKPASSAGAYGAPQTAPWGSGQIVQMGPDGRYTTIYTPPQPSAGRDLRMSDYERAQLGLNAEDNALAQAKFVAETARYAGLDALNQDKFTYQKQNDATNMNWEKEKQAATVAYQNAQLAYQQASLEATKAYQNAQLEVDKTYKDALIENAKAQLAETKRQFDVAEQRLRRASALAEVQANQQAQGQFFDRFHTTPEYAGVPGYGRITPEDIQKMVQPY